MDANDLARRDVLKAAGLFAAGTGLSRLLGPWPARGERQQPAAAMPIGQREILAGLDAMSRVADDGNDPFADGHAAAAVMASAFFCKENDLDVATQDAIRALLEGRLLAGPLFAPRPQEAADPALAQGLVDDLDHGIDALRRSGHNIIFAVVSLKALREVPEAATPARVAGLRAMVRSFPAEPVSSDARREPPPDPSDEAAFIRFVFAEYLAALQLYLEGRGHHGFAGHVVTVGHALVELCRLGHADTARKGLPAYREFVAHARRGADLGGRRVAAAPARAPRPLDRDYWVAQRGRRMGGFASSHVVKYPYSFYALLVGLTDDELKRRVLEKVDYLTAVS